MLGAKEVGAVWRLTAERTALRWAEFDGWNRQRLDAVLCPPHSVPALPHRSSGDFTLSLSYAFRWTLLNFPAGIVPVTRVRPDETAESFDRTPDKVEKKLRDIAQTNREALLEMMEQFEQFFAELKKDIDEDDGSNLFEFFERSKNSRDAIL